jgi:hypothetical protein
MSHHGAGVFTFAGGQHKSMSFFRLLPQLISGPSELFELALEGRARPVMMFNLTITGITYGLSNLYGTLQQTPDLPMHGQYALITPMMFSMFGIFTMLGAMLGLILVYWAAAKAFGGHGGLMLVMDLIGLAGLPFWFLAPLLNWALNYNQQDSIPLILLIPLVLVFVWSFKLIRQSMVTGQGLTVGRATLALGCMWIFSISAVYLFMP